MSARGRVAETQAPVPRLSALICVLIVGFLLYNPFLALLHSPGGLTVQHQSRNRATVGAGELQDFSPVSSELAKALPEERSSEIPASASGQESHLASDLRPDAVITLEFSSNLWFRPPPTA